MILQEEFEAFKDTSEQVAEAKDTELERLLGVNASLRDEITVLNSRQVALSACLKLLILAVSTSSFESSHEAC